MYLAKRSSVRWCRSKCIAARAEAFMVLRSSLRQEHGADAKMHQEMKVAPHEACIWA
jgi:hypothetical protein